MHQQWVIPAILCLLCANTSVSGSPIYQNDFETSAGPEWDNPGRDTAPAGQVFLGRGNNDSRTLTLTNLPSHSAVRLTFDLYIIESWDGNNTFPAYVGPDHWKLLVVGGPVLMDTTFGGGNDSYPEFEPGGGVSPYLASYTAGIFGSLGYIFFGTPNSDAVYTLQFLIPHSASTVGFEFSGYGLQNLADESWGLDNVRVDLDPQAVPAPSALWVALGGMLLLIRRWPARRQLPAV
ncbi:MAG: hypothetical protein JSS02_27630 [Planctomycetes bacterium]|nr:hypothetical protein [Planctomycetota bacterium]